MQTDLFGAPPAPEDRFERDAEGFLRKFAASHRGKPFSSEDVTMAAAKKGVAPSDWRAWGPVFSRVARDGAIRRSEKAFRRTFGNGTLAPGWEAA